MTEYERRIASFAYFGLSLGASPRDMMRAFPDPRRVLGVQHNNVPGWIGYAIAPPDDDPVYQLGLAFLDNTLFLISLVYAPSTVEAMGSWHTLLRHLSDEYGPDCHDVKGLPVALGGVADYLWRFPDVSRSVELIVNEEYTHVDYLDIQIDHKYSIRVG